MALSGDVGWWTDRASGAALVVVYAPNSGNNPVNMCVESGCEKNQRSRGYCYTHYHKNRRIGVLQLIRPEGRTVEERFWSKVDFGVGDDCWLWTGAKSLGYGQIKLEKIVWAHRISYQLMIGPIPDGYEIDHLCRNRPCVNPRHLEAVTGTENRRRACAVRWGKVPA